MRLQIKLHLLIAEKEYKYFPLNIIRVVNKGTNYSFKIVAYEKFIRCEVD